MPKTEKQPEPLRRVPKISFCSRDTWNGLVCQKCLTMLIARQKAAIQNYREALTKLN